MAAPVANFRPNAFGLYDMAGNVGEWCADGIDQLPAPGPAEAVRWEDYPPGPARDPLRTPMDGGGRILRGGWWWCDASWQARSAHRDEIPTNTADRIIGFRPARQVPRE